MSEPIEKEEIIEAMQSHGGSFIRALAWTWVVGDKYNRERLEKAFKAHWMAYEVVAQAKRELKSTRK